MKPSLVISGGFFFVLPALTAALTVNDILTRCVDAYARSQLQKRDTVSDILADIEDAADCTACQALLVVLQAVAHLGNDAFSDTIITVCQGLGIEDDDVCAGAIGLEGPILAHDLRNMDIGSKTAELFCLTIFGLCQWPAVDTSYTLSMTPKPATSRPASSGKTPIQVVHISDIHVDRNYTTGTSYNCTKNVCCRAYDADDAVGVTDYPAGPYGEPECDSPVTLEQSMYAAIEELVPDRAFTIFTGDVIVGDVWETTDDEVTGGLNDAYSRMTGIGQTYAVIGNHDTCPVDSFPPPAIDTTYAAETQIFYTTLSDDIEDWIGSSAASSVANNFGSYSVVDSKTGLRLISVNTNFWYKSNYWMYESTMESDPAGMFAWLVSELEAAETAKERVWLMGHMPLGSSDAFHDYSYYFDTIIQRFDATISAVFYGHTHKDEFEIAYSDYANQTAATATMMSYIAPALTPTSGNPTFRVYTVDPVTFGILDMTTYYTNISSPTYQSGPTWEKLYAVKETYGAALSYTEASAELTPAFWHNVTTLFESDDAIFQEYYARKSRNFDVAATCTGDCKTDEICQLRAAQAQYNCAAVTPGVSFRKKRDLRSVQDADEEHACESSIVAPVMASIYSNEGIASLRSALVQVAGAAFLNSTVSSNFTVGD